jgi:hypothetical protein
MLHQILSSGKYNRGKTVLDTTTNMPIGSIVATGNSTITKEIILNEIIRVASLLLKHS